ncbi:hypothetical protein D3C86_1968690 [compost metagenome]
MERPQVIALGKTVDGALDGAQCLAAAYRRLGTHNLVAQVAHAARQSGQGRFGGFLVGVTPFHLIEQGNQFAAQGLPFAGLRFRGQVGHFRGLIGAGHDLSLS